MPSGRVSKLANGDFAKSVAEAYINGCSRAEMAELFGAHVDTIGDWVKDARVQVHCSRLVQERVNRITRKVDKEIEMRLEDAEDMPTELLLKVRKEFMERARVSEFNGKGDQAETINDMVQNLEDNPDLARQIQAMAQGKPYTPSAS